MPKRIEVSDETLELIEMAKENKRAWYGQDTKMTNAEALDWLLQDIREYGSPVVKSWTRKVYGEITKSDPSPASGTTG